MGRSRDAPSLFGDDFDAPGVGAYGHARDPIPIPPRDPNVTEAGERKRLAGQNAAILLRLRRGPATNAELAELSLKYSGRVSDLRAVGCTIDSRRIDGGTFRYTLTHEPPGLIVEG